MGKKMYISSLCYVDYIYRFEPFFEESVPTANINHKKKAITPCHGYCLPHKHGKANQAYAKKIGYTFRNW